MSIATMTSKGQITIPKPIRDALRLRPGDRVDFALGPEGEVRMVPARQSLASLVGSLKPRRKGLTIEEMDRVIRRKDARP